MGSIITLVVVGGALQIKAVGNMGVITPAPSIILIVPTKMRTRCQIYNWVGHSALDCHHHLDYAYQGRNAPPKFAAMVASNQFPVDQTWYTDTG